MGDTELGMEVVAIPFPLPGHIRPMLQLCRVLLHATPQACTVTFINTTRNTAHLAKLLGVGQDQFPSATSPITSAPPLRTWGGRLRVVTVDLQQDAPAGSWDFVRGLLRAFDQSLPLAVDRVLDNYVLPMTGRRVACVLADVYLAWAQDLADRLRVPRVALWTSLAAELQVYLHASSLLSQGILPFKVPSERSTFEEDIDDLVPGTRLASRPLYHRVPDNYQEKVHIPGIGNLDRKDFPSFLQIEDKSDFIFSFYIDQVRRVGEASLLLINTIHDLEESVFNSIKVHNNIDAHAIGPLFMLEEQIVGVDHNDSISNESMEWLDKQKPHSVMYVAFGSTGRLSPSNLKELVEGLKASKQHFLVACGHLVDPNELDISDQGILVEWAPQSHILQHPAIGGFLSHCGWNSTLESLSGGVPILGCPFTTDQVLTSKLIVHPWEVGLQLKKPTHKDVLFDANQVSLLTRELIEGEKGKRLRARAQNWKAIAKTYLSSGSLPEALGLFIDRVHICRDD